MNIWILTSETPHYWGGGIARYVDNFARLVGETGSWVTVISRGPAKRQTRPGERFRLVEFEHRHDAPAIAPASGEPDEHPRWPYNNMAYFAALSYQYAEEVCDLIRENGAPDVIECQEYGAIGYFLMLRKLTGDPLLADIPIVVHLHTPDFVVRGINEYPRFKLPDYWIGRMEMASIRMADALLAPSRFMAKALPEHLDGPPDSIVTIPYPVPNLPRIQTGQAGEAGRIVYPGRLELRKGVEPLLAASERLWEAGEGFVLELVGGDVPTPTKGGSLEAYLKRKYAKRIESGHLVIHGSQPHQRCLDLMASATAVVVPSLWENFPNTCIEAMALGKVVVGSSTGGQAEMIGLDGAAGILFDHSAHLGLETAIRKALSLSERERVAMGTAASHRIHDLCAPDQVMPKRLEHFEAVIRGYAQPKRFPFNNESLRSGPLAKELDADPLITVVVPFFNLGSYIEECLDGILSNKGVRLEVLIVNDGSTDPASIEALDTIRKAGHRNVQILDIPNGGLANARNQGAKAARGDLLAFVDADDVIGPEFLAKASAVLKRYRNVHYAYSWVRFIGDGKGIWHAWPTDLPYMLCHNLLIPIVVIRRDSYLAAGQNKPHIVYGLEDYEGWLSMAEAGMGGVAIPEPLVFYRIRGASMFRKIENDKKIYLYDLIAREHPSLLARHAEEVFGLQNANGPSQAWLKPACESPYDAKMRWYGDNLEKVKGHRDRLENNLRKTQDWANDLHRQIDELKSRLKEQETAPPQAESNPEIRQLKIQLADKEAALRACENQLKAPWWKRFFSG